MNKKYLDKLEYESVLAELSSFCKTESGKELCMSLEPAFSFEKVSKLQLQTLSAFTILVKYSTPPISSFASIDLSLKKLKSNNILSPKELLDIARILQMSRDLSGYFDDIKKETEASEYSSIENYFLNLYCNIELEKEIFSKIIDDTTLDDKASNNLYSIRKNIKLFESQIKEKLYKFIHTATYSKYMMDPVITIRNNRFVVPVKSEYRSLIPGFIHDISSSGSTVFIEPTAIFELNNKINSLKLDENIEIEKILANISDKIKPFVELLCNDVQLISNIDFLFAKAEYAKATDSISPTLNKDKKFNLIKARHPLISKKSVVPINVYLGLENSSLVITGPNTGGKTVTLKTVGLLHLMAYSGLMIPANEHSSIFVFDNIFADIGDEQSISESLSTFSSHMKNIIEITNLATCQSLILLDELGSGTDPIEGSRFAISILEYFNNLGCLCISTTHYQEIKNYVMTHDHFINASAEFDIENLKPTYNIIMGIPGKSNAFAISRKLGLNTKILDRAQDLVNSDETKIEDLLKQIYDDKKAIETEKINIENYSNEIKKLRESLSQDNIEKQIKSKEIIENAKIEARNILLSAKDEATSIIRKINSLPNSNNNENIKDLNNLRNSLNNSIKNIGFATDENNNITLEKSDLVVGTNVIIKNLNQRGTISGKVSNNRVEVLVGSNKLNVDISNLELDNSIINKKDTFVKSTAKSNITTKNVSSEINVIGLNVDEAVYVIDKYLDDCSLSSIKKVRIVHGKGTGKLRTGIHSFLKSNSHVKSFRIGTFGEGEMGVTIVELK